MELEIGQIYKATKNCGRELGVIEYLGYDEDSSYRQYKFKILSWYEKSYPYEIVNFPMCLKTNIGSATTTNFQLIGIEEARQYGFWKFSYFEEYESK